MSSSSHGGDDIPKSFPEVTPTGDLLGYKGTITYAIGELTSEIRHLAESIKQQSTKIDGLQKELNEQKEITRKIETKILVAETQVKSAFYTSKWFLAVISAIFGWAIGHLQLIGQWFGKT